MPHCIVMRASMGGFFVVYERPAVPEIGYLGLGVSCLWHPGYQVDGSHPSIVRDENTSLQSALTRIKKVMLSHGATAEAVEFVGALAPFSQEELEVMAAKLSKKPAAKAETKAKAASEKKAPAGKPKGNADALAKAREERAAKAAENRKYKTLVKLKDLSLREGTWTEAMVQAILGNNTTDDAKAAVAKHSEFGDRKPDFSWVEKKGYISF